MTDPTKRTTGSAPAPSAGPPTGAAAVPPAAPAAAPPPAPAAVGPDPSARHRVQAGVPRTPDEQRVDLGELREELGATVDELSRRVDVAARVRARRDATVAQARRLGGQAQTAIESRVPAARAITRNPTALASVAAGLVLAVLLVRRLRK